MSIFLPIIMSVVVNFSGYTFANEGATCTIRNHSNETVQTTVADDDGWCEYRVQPGVTYTVSAEGKQRTFIAVDHNEEYNLP